MSLPPHSVIDFLLSDAPPIPHLFSTLLKVGKSPPLVSSASCRLNFLPSFVGRIFQTMLLLSWSPFVVLSDCSDRSTVRMQQTGQSEACRVVSFLLHLWSQPHRLELSQLLALAWC